VQVGAPEGDRQARQRRDAENDRDESKHVQPPGPAVHQPKRGVADPREGKNREASDPDNEVECQRKVERLVVPPRPLDLLAGKHV
jgi:hypothetical protein